MKSSWQHAANESVDRHFEQMVSVRKNLHANPELSGKEHDTSLFLYQTLSNAGLDVRIGPEGRGLVADMRVTDQRHDIPAMALRADIDALPIHDQKQVPYSSQSDGGMHACGHDVHSAIVLGTMMTLARSEERRVGIQVVLRGRSRSAGYFSPPKKLVKVPVR